MHNSNTSLSIITQNVKHRMIFYYRIHVDYVVKEISNRLSFNGAAQYQVITAVEASMNQKCILTATKACDAYSYPHRKHWLTIAAVFITCHWIDFLHFPIFH